MGVAKKKKKIAEFWPRPLVMEDEECPMLVPLVLSDGSEDTPVSSLDVSATNNKIPVTIITGFLGKD